MRRNHWFGKSPKFLLIFFLKLILFLLFVCQLRLFYRFYHWMKLFFLLKLVLMLNEWMMKGSLILCKISEVMKWGLLSGSLFYFWVSLLWSRGRQLKWHLLVLSPGYWDWMRLKYLIGNELNFFNEIVLECSLWVFIGDVGKHAKRNWRRSEWIKVKK